MGDRWIHTIAWETLYTIGGRLEDTLLLRPRLIAARSQHLYAYDFGDGRLKAFDMHGRLLWTLGRHGGGPGEFGNPTHLAVGREGTIWLTDAGASRFTLVSPRGELERHIPFDGRMIMRAVPQEHEAIAILMDPQYFWMVLDEGGRAIQRAELPAALRDVNPATRAPFVSGSPAGESWAVVFAFGDPLFIYEGRSLRCTGRLIEGGAFPEAPSRDNPVWAAAVAVTDTSVYVLPRGRTQDDLQILDEYSLTDCQYRRSLRLPRRLQAIAYNDGIFYFYHEDPAPTLLALRTRE